MEVVKITNGTRPNRETVGVPVYKFTFF
jgi:hypothetical protein